MDIFEQASRDKLRFPSNKGRLTVEDLWDLPLTSKSGFDLDNVAKAVNHDLKASSEESFVETATNPARNAHVLQLDICKHIIAVKIQERDEQKNKAAKLEKRRLLLEILEGKQNEALRNKSPEELQKMLDELGA